MLTNHQEELYTLYKEIDKICRDNGIEYAVAGGTTIGAVRHRGFIPWDDDMDIDMTRDNWYKFMDVCNNGALPEGRILDCQETNRGFHNPIARYTDITKTAIHKNQVLHDDSAGFVIDIFCCDPIPNDKEALEQYTKDILLFSDLINGTLVYSYRFRTNRFRYFWYMAKMKFVGRDKVLSQVEGKLTQYNEEDCDFLVQRWGGVPLCFPKEMVGHCSVNLPYEDITAMSYDKTIDYLVYHYGDEWMFLPPVTEQQGHDAVFDSQIAYPVFRNEIEHFVNKKKANKKYRTRQKIALLSENAWNDLKDLNYHIHQVSYEMEFSVTLRDKHEEIEQAKKNKDYIAILEIFSDYISKQNDRRAIGRFDYVGAYRYYSPVLIKIPTEYFELVLKALFNTNQISIAKRFIEVYEFSTGEKTPLMQELEDDIMAFRRAVSAYADKDFASCAKTADYLLEKYPKNIAFIKFNINLIFAMDKADEQEETLKSLITMGFQLYPKDGDLIKYSNDITVKTNKSKALLGYLDAWDNTLNGLTRLDIMDIVKENLDFYLDYTVSCIGKTVKTDNLDVNRENAYGEIISPFEMMQNRETSLAVLIVNKLSEIVSDNVKIQNTKFVILEKLADMEKSPLSKAKAQYRLISEILELRLYYIEKFIKNEYGEMETLITKWYYRYYKSINHSDFVTLTSAELIATEDYNNFEILLDKLDDYMRGLEKTVPEYMYCLELRGEILYNMGESEAAYKIFCRCAMENTQPYLTIVLQEKFKNDISNTYKELLESYNKGFIHKSLEGSGLTNEEYYLKTISNKKRLLNFYKKKIQNVYPTAVYYIDILTKIHLLTEEEAKQIIISQKIKKGSKLGLKTIKVLHKTIIGYDPEIEDDSDFLEELTEDSINLHSNTNYSRSVTNQ